MPVELEVESEVTALLVEDRPEDSEVTPLCAALIPLEVEVDSEATALPTDDRPEESEVTPL
jgi:hypothetical protein